MPLKKYRVQISALMLLCILLGMVLIPANLALPVFASDDPNGDEGVAAQQVEEEVEIEMDNILFYADMPTYYQNDYPDVRYATSTLEEGGCSMTALAMVSSYMTGHEYTPDALARYFGGKAVNSLERLELASDKLGLEYYKAENWAVVYEALKEGKVAILLVKSPSSFTTSQHFIILCGITKDGKVLVKDPNAKNYQKWDLKQGFASGFPTYDLWSCWEGGWVYDKNCMPENPAFYYEEPIDHSNPRYPDVESNLTDSDLELIARVVWAEARGEDLRGQQAVAEVLLNRLNSPNFPNRIHDVVYGEGQFRTSWMLDKAKPSQAQYDAIERAIYGPYILPETVVFFAWEKVNDNVWGNIGKHIFCHEFDLEEEEEETRPEEETVPEETVPEETVPDETVPDEDVPDETLPEEVTQEETEPEATEALQEEATASDDTGGAEDPEALEQEQEDLPADDPEAAGAE